MPPSSRVCRFLAIGSVTLVAAACASAGAPTRAQRQPPSGQFTVEFRYDFYPSDGSGITALGTQNGSACGVDAQAGAQGRLAFLQPNADVVLQDPSGATAAKATLGTGTTSNTSTDNTTGATTFTCTWRVTFTIGMSHYYVAFVHGNELGTVSAADRRSGGDYVVSLDSLTPPSPSPSPSATRP